jgi:replicative superfamily II helicase
LKEEDRLDPTTLGRIASRYYIEHMTIRHFGERLRRGMALEELLLCLTDCPEYAEIPVRHNEDELNKFVCFCFLIYFFLFIFRLLFKLLFNLNNK